MGLFTVKGTEYLLGTGLKGVTPLATLYVGFGTATGLTRTATSITESTDGNYARKPITAAQWGSFIQNASSQTETSNTADITTNTWAANQPSALNTVGAFSTLTGGDLLMVHQLATPITPAVGQAVKFSIGQLKATLS